MLEADYQADLIERIISRLPGCMVIKMDPKAIQGIPDLLVLCGPNWAMLEVKTSSDADHRPNQDWYVDTFNRMSFSAFIYPENEEDVLSALQSSFGVRGQACLTES